MNLFDLTNVSYYYPNQDGPALDRISATIEEGEWVLVLGASGSGKSTFARLLTGLLPDFYGGTLIGNVSFRAEPLTGRQNLAREIGFVFQDTERQMLAESVMSELVFGMENLGLPPQEMRKRLAEVIGYLNLRGLCKRKTKTLSGGEKQRIVLGAILAMGPRVLVLDEPTARLDPIASEEVFQLLHKLHQDLGYTILLIEHETDCCLPLADRILYFEDGKITRDLSRHEFVSAARGKESLYLPKVTQAFQKMMCGALPVTVGEGRKWLAQNEPPALGRAEAPNRDSRHIPSCSAPPAISMRNVSFSYSKETPLFQRLSLNIPAGQIVAIIGENGAGKSTLLKLAAGCVTLQTGEIRIFHENIHKLSGPLKVRTIGYLSQQPDEYLFHDTVYEELAFTLRHADLPVNGNVHDTLRLLDMDMHAQRNPRDLSVGERERVALASILVTNPKLLLLDEPTRGIEPRRKESWSKRLKQWVRKECRSVVLVTQDIELVAECADSVVMLSRGELIAEGPSREVFEQNLFFSPQMNRLFRGYSRGVLTRHDARIRLRSMNQVLEPQ